MRGTYFVKLEDLNQYFIWKNRIKTTEAELKEVCELSAFIFNGMPHSPSIGDPVYNTFRKKEKLEQKLKFQYQRALDELVKISDYIDSIENEEMKEILLQRFILCRRYQDIGDTLYMDRRTVSRKITEFLKNNP